MRFVPIQSVREGAILKKPIFSQSGDILLREDVVLKDAYIQQLRSIGINGVYIEDDISKDIEIISNISDDLKNKAVQKVKSAFLNVK